MGRIHSRIGDGMKTAVKLRMAVELAEMVLIPYGITIKNN